MRKAGKLLSLSTISDKWNSTITNNNNNNELIKPIETKCTLKETTLIKRTAE